MKFEAMDGVGTDLGRVYKGVQGKGVAQEVSTPITDKFIADLPGRMDLLRRENEAKKKADADDFQKRVDALNTARNNINWQAQDESKAATLDYLGRAGEYYARTGQNPLLSKNRDSDAIELQRQYQDLMAMAGGINDYAEELKKWQDIAIKDPSKYTPESIKAMTEGTLMEKFSSGKVPKPVPIAPMGDVLTLSGKIGKDVDVNDVGTIRRNAVLALNGSGGLEYVNSLTNIYDKFSPEQQEALNQRADAASQEQGRDVTPQEQMLVEITMENIRGGSDLGAYEKNIYEEARKYSDDHRNADGSHGPKKSQGIKAAVEQAKSNPYMWQRLMEKYGGEAAYMKHLRSLNFGSTGAASDDDSGGGGGRGALQDARETVISVLEGVKQGNPAAQGAYQGHDVYVKSKTGGAVRGKIKNVVALPRQSEADPQKFAVTVFEEKVGSGGKGIFNTITMTEAEAAEVLVSASMKALNSKQGQEEVSKTGVLDN